MQTMRIFLIIALCISSFSFISLIRGSAMGKGFYPGLMIAALFASLVLAAIIYSMNKKD
jgi:hypothetical protein